jgi:hypothetical protein
MVGFEKVVRPEHPSTTIDSGHSAIAAFSDPMRHVQLGITADS